MLYPAREVARETYQESQLREHTLLFPLSSYLLYLCYPLNKTGATKEEVRLPPKRVSP